ncbi:phosphatase PAP2 family protein [Oenococcus alcoholitolerans]|uniref:Phospholipid phosphatase n=1 Tax=Oenococcus alcoholitolerans TaxID=931074 RepID=A0ABR4XQL6_9LACO|nr:phospholipid phosphatase [Oenococcus alcoholitolerans]
MIVRMPEYLKKAGIAAAIVFLLLLLLVGLRLNSVSSLDRAVSNALAMNDFTAGSLFLRTVWILGSPLADFIYAVILSGLLYFSNLRIPAIWIMLTYITGIIVGQILKVAIGRTRPAGHLSGGYSFPSNHLLAAFIVITIIFVLILPNLSSNNLKVWFGWAAITFGLLLIEAGVYLQEHFITDNLAGGSFGIAWVTLWIWLYEKYARRLHDRIPALKYDEI